jgi:glycosyltransferase involved in cell wall biosynthesis
MTRALVVHAGNLWGGVERVLVALAELPGLRRQTALSFALAFEGPVAEALRRTGTPVHLIGPARASRPWSVWRARRRLASLLHASAAEVVITQSAWSLALFGDVATAAGLPLVHWVHDVLDGRHWTERLASRHRPDLLVCNSHHSAACAAVIFPDVPSCVVYAPLTAVPQPAGAARAIRSRFDTPEDVVVIVQVGRAEPLKGHRVLLAALEQLADVPGWVCWQVGAPQRAAETEYWRSMQSLACHSAVGHRVRFVGHAEDVAAVLQAADVYCQPNTGPEAYGLTLVEAMQAGLPVVTSRIGAAPEVLAGTDNLLVEPGDAAGVAAALRVLVLDAALRERLGRQGPARAGALADPAVVQAAIVDALSRVLRAA